MKGEITCPFPLNGATVEVWECINNYIPQFAGHGISYPCWDSSYSMLVKGVPRGKYDLVKHNRHVSVK